jgi:outer membrane protein TolC
VATLSLGSYAGITDTNAITLVPPDIQMSSNVTTKKVLDEAYENRSDALAFTRRIAEARRDVSKARADNGLNATLTARLGFSKSAAAISKVYEQPRDQQLVQLDFTIPILDWGRSRSRTKTAQTNLKFVEYAVEQDKQTFVQEIVTQVSLYETMRDQVLLSLEADSIATEKYQIAKERYVLGDLSITDLSIAFQEKDQAKRDYVAALRDYWGAYFRLRFLSLYDFEKNEKINYK